MGLLRLIPRFIILSLKVSITWRMIEAVWEIIKQVLAHLNLFCSKTALLEKIGFFLLIKLIFALLKSNNILKKMLIFTKAAQEQGHLHNSVVHFTLRK